MAPSISLTKHGMNRAGQSSNRATYKIPKKANAGLPLRRGHDHNGKTAARGGPRVGEPVKSKTNIGQVKEILQSLAKGAEIRLASTTQASREAIKDALWGTYDACVADIGIKFLLSEEDKPRGWISAPNRLDDIDDRLRNAPRGPRFTGTRATLARAPGIRNQSCRKKTTTYPPDEKDPDKYLGVPRPFEGLGPYSKPDRYTGPAYGDHRHRQIRNGIVPGIYPDEWVNGQTFGAIEKDQESAKRLFLGEPPYPAFRQSDCSGISLTPTGKGNVTPSNQDYQASSVPSMKAMNVDLQRTEDNPGSEYDSIMFALQNYHLEDTHEASVQTRESLRKIETGVEDDQKSEFLIDLEPIRERAPTYTFSMGSEASTTAGGLYGYPATSDVVSEALLEFSDACGSVINFNTGSVSYPRISPAPSEAKSRCTVGTRDFISSAETVYSYSGGSLFNSPYGSRKTAPSVFSDAFDFPVIESSGSLLRGHAAILRQKPAPHAKLAISNWAADVSLANEKEASKKIPGKNESHDRVVALASAKWGAPIAPRGKPAMGFEWGDANCQSQA